MFLLLVPREVVRQSKRDLEDGRRCYLLPQLLHSKYFSGMRVLLYTAYTVLSVER